MSTDIRFGRERDTALPVAQSASVVWVVTGDCKDVDDKCIWAICYDGYTDCSNGGRGAGVGTGFVIVCYILCYICFFLCTLTIVLVVCTLNVWQKSK